MCVSFSLPVSVASLMSSISFISVSNSGRGARNTINVSNTTNMTTKYTLDRIGLITFASTHRLYVSCTFFIYYNCTFFFADGIIRRMTCLFRNGITFLYMHSFAFRVCYRFTFRCGDSFACLVKVCFAFPFINRRALFIVVGVTFLLCDRGTLLLIIHRAFIFRCGGT